MELRASSDHRQLFPLLFFSIGGRVSPEPGVGCPIVGASDEHGFIVRVLRARETVLPLYSLPSFCLPQSGPCD